jgi:predicted esterase
VRTAIAALLLLVSAAGRGEEYKRGEIVDGVACAANSSITYAFYLPSRYTTSERWPILFVFDPRKRGAFAAELFREPAEQYGWIVVSSNNTESDADAQPSVRAIELTLPDAQKRFSVDAHRIYVAGFSGTAIIAWALADVTKSVTGMIGCSGRPLPDPNYKVSFHWFGTAGNRDFNYLETNEIDRGLAGAGASHRLEIFDGPHRWAPPDFLRQGVEWMELQAMKSGARPRDEDLIKQLFATEVAAARAELEPLAAVRRYESIARTFDGLVPVDEPRQRAMQLRASREYSKAVDAEKRAEELEHSYRKTLSRVMQAFMQNEESPIAASLAHDLQITLLQRIASKGSYEGLAAQRVLEGIYVQVSFYAARQVTGQKLAVLKAVADTIQPQSR